MVKKYGSISSVITNRRRSLRNNKKGSLLDIIYIAGFLLAAAMFILIGYKIMDSLNTEFQAHADIPADAKTASATLTGYYPSVIDNSFLFLTVGIALVTFVLAALVRIHPIFIAFYIIGLGFVIFLSAVYSNVYQEIASNTLMVSLANNLTVTTTIMGKLPWFVGIFGTILMLVMYKNWKLSQFDFY